eukprot:12169_1
MSSLTSKRLPALPSLFAAKSFGHLMPFKPMMPLIPFNGSYDLSLTDTKRYPKYKEEFTMKSNDILINSYPKCGYHWLKKTMIEIVRANDGENTHELYKTADLGLNTSPCIEYYLLGGIITDNEINERLEMSKEMYPRIWLSHCQYTKLAIKAFDTNSKIITICRNPKDQIISGTKFYDVFNKQIFPVDSNEEERTLTIEDYISYFVRGIIPYGCYFEFYENLWKIYQERSHNMLWLYYEDMIDNPLENVQKIATFIYDDQNEKSKLNLN